MKKLLSITAMLLVFATFAEARTLIVYYSYTKNVEQIVNELRTRIEADVLEIEPAEKGLDYAADNYAIGSALISAIRNNPDNASSYPAIDPVNVNMSDYNAVIIAVPLWWSNMAAPMQSFLFSYGREMQGKKIGLIVSSASSGISGVEADARRLVPDGDFLSPSLWIRSSQTSAAGYMLDNWLEAIDYNVLVSSIESVESVNAVPHTIYSLTGARISLDASGSSSLYPGIYIINGKKTFVK